MVATAWSASTQSRDKHNTRLKHTALGRRNTCWQKKSTAYLWKIPVPPPPCSIVINLPLTSFDIKNIWEKKSRKLLGNKYDWFNCPNSKPLRFGGTILKQELGATYTQREAGMWQWGNNTDSSRLRKERARSWVSNYTNRNVNAWPRRPLLPVGECDNQILSWLIAVTSVNVATYNKIEWILPVVIGELSWWVKEVQRFDSSSIFDCRLPWLQHAWIREILYLYKIWNFL